MKKTIADMKGFRAAFDAALETLGAEFNVRVTRTKIVHDDEEPNKFTFTINGFEKQNRDPHFMEMSPEEKFKRSPFGQKRVAWLNRTVQYNHQKFKLVGATSYRPDAKLVLTDGENEYHVPPTEVKLLPAKRDIKKTVVKGAVAAAAAEAHA